MRDWEVEKMIGLVGKKVGMKSILKEEGVYIKVKVIEVEEKRVNKVKEMDKDG